MDGNFYHLCLGGQWKAIPRSLVAGSIAHDYFQLRQKAGVFHQLWHAALKLYDDQVGIKWLWQAGDGAMTKAPLGSETTGRNPTEQGERGVKRSIVTDGRGALGRRRGCQSARYEVGRGNPVSVGHGSTRAQPATAPKLCLDKGYDFDPVRQLLPQSGYTAHLQTRGEEK